MHNPHSSRLPRFLTPSLLLVVLTLLLPTIYNLIQINLLSFDYLKAQFSRLSTDPIDLPTFHPRRLTWEITSTLQKENYPLALQLASPRAQTGDFYSLQVVARSQEALGNYPAALAIWKEIQDTTALLRLAKAAEAAGQLESAREAYTSLWKLRPITYTDYLAGFLRRQGDLPAAEDLYRQVLDLSSAEALGGQLIERVPVATYRPYWLFQLADILEKQSHWSEAAQAYEQGILESPNMYWGERHLPLRYSNLAWAYNMSNQTEKALSAIQTAINNLPVDPGSSFEVWLRAAQIYEGLGMLPEAISACQSALQIKPDNTTARKALQHLQIP